VRVGEIRKIQDSHRGTQKFWGVGKGSRWGAKMGEQRAARHLVTPLYMDAPREKPLLFLRQQLL
jgi:hypothetical protein